MSTDRTNGGGSVGMTNTGVSSIRSRDAVLEMLVPKLLGIVWTSGRFEQPGFNAKCAPDLSIGAARFCEDAIALSVWDPSTKLLSLHIARDTAMVDPARFRYMSGKCCVLNWKRGKWEDEVMKSAAEPRAMHQAFYSGLTR